MNILVNADEESVGMGILFARGLNASVTVLETAETAERGETATAQFREAGIQADLIRRKSDWLRALRVATRACRYDLAIVGKMWRRGVTGLLFGSIPRALLADLRADLLIVRHAPAKITRLLVAVSAGPGRMRVLRWGGLAARAFDARPVLLHVTERAPGMFDGLAGVDENLSQFMRSATFEARTLQMAAESLRAQNVEPELKLAHGPVEDELVAEARAGSYDLIVLGSSYYGRGAARWLMSRVTESVIKHAPCSVLVASVDKVNGSLAGAGT